MIIVKLQGGLGNQMFQFAAARRLATVHRVELKADLHVLRYPELFPAMVPRTYDLDIFPNLDLPEATADEVAAMNINPLFNRVLTRFPSVKRLVRARGTEIQQNSPPGFDGAILDGDSPAYIDGYWQSENYFSDIRQFVLKTFWLPGPIDSPGAELAAKIRACGDLSVCVNVRRGDFVSHEHSKTHHGACGIGYFRSAISELAGLHGQNHQYFVFSDDVAWCEANLNFIPNAVFVSHDYAGRKFSTYLYLMTICQHFIVPNSTFGWWAAWLGEKQRTEIFTPARWYMQDKHNSMINNLVPARWNRVS